MSRRSSIDLVDVICRFLFDTSCTILRGFDVDGPILFHTHQADQDPPGYLLSGNSENLYAPHILRALSNVKMTRIFSGPSAMHCVGVDGESDKSITRSKREKGILIPSLGCGVVHGNAHMIGRNTPSSVLGIPASQLPFSPCVPTGSTTPPSKAKGKQPDPESTIPVVVKILASDLAKSSSSTSTPTKIVGAACARHHTLLVGSCGRVWACGNNSDGRLGLPIKGKGEDVTVFTQVRGPWEADKGKVVQVS